MEGEEFEDPMTRSDSEFWQMIGAPKEVEDDLFRGVRAALWADSGGISGGVIARYFTTPIGPVDAVLGPGRLR